MESFKKGLEIRIDMHQEKEASDWN